jgi:hypothetical protein
VAGEPAVSAAAVAAAIAAAVWTGWCVALVRALLRLRAEVEGLQARVDSMVVAELHYARLWLPERPEGGSGGEKPSE